MKRIESTTQGPTGFRLVAAAVAALLMAGPVLAAKPGGGGGTPPPAGTIYYSNGSMKHMRPDGSGKTPLPIQAAMPSRQLHGGKRWFLRLEEVTGPSHYDAFFRLELFAEREDGAIKVQLTDDPGLQFGASEGYQFAWRWAPDETPTSVTVGGLAKRWLQDGSFVPGSAGAYTATLRFDSAGDVIGLDAPPAFAVDLGTVLWPGASSDEPASHWFSWAPDMSAVVAEWRSQVGIDGGDEWAHELRIVDVATGTPTTLVQDAVMRLSRPEWSPDGARVVFQSNDAIESVAVDGSDRRVLTTASRGGSVRLPFWSPDSALVVYTRTKMVQGSSGTTYEYDVWRMTAAGGNQANLTQDTTTNCMAIGWR